MKENLQNILDALLEECLELKINPNELCSSLQVDNILTLDEVDIINGERTRTDKLLKLITLLKSKSDEKVFSTLEKAFHKNGWSSNIMQSLLKDVGNEITFSQDLAYPSDMYPNSKCRLLSNVCTNLKEHYNEDLELMEKYWDKLDVRGRVSMETFYNQNIEISDKSRKLEKKILNFDHIFEADYKRIIVSAEAGYGKSTFVHEMARQWVKGENIWTKKFLFLFLFRCGEVRENETCSLQNLLGKCLNEKDTQSVKDWLIDASNKKKCLFIFDGLDEFQHSFGDDIKDLVFGKGLQQSHVVITSRPGSELEQLRSGDSRNLFIQLKGFTDEGAKQQLRKFSVSFDENKTETNDFLKVPLFNTLYCITNGKSTVPCSNLCTAIGKFIKFACDRYRMSNREFTKEQEMELMLTLGKVAQSKFLFMDGIKKIEFITIKKELFKQAIRTGLILKKSIKEEEDIIFSHHTFGEYFAAYFWSETTSLDVEKVSTSCVYFTSPPEAFCYLESLFSCFLSHFNNTYKEFLWKNFDENIPLLDNYKSLPKRRPIIKKNLAWVHDYDMFFKKACNRFRKAHQFFTATEENNLFLILGQAAQTKYNFMKDTNIKYPVNVTRQILSIGITIGLLDQSSTLTDLHFKQDFYADYCAAYFWSQTSSLAIQRFSDRCVYFSDPAKGYCPISQAFSGLLSYFNVKYQARITEYEQKYFPFTQKNRMWIRFSSQTASDQKRIMDKFDFSSDDKGIEYLCLYRARFEHENRFKTIENLDCFLTLNSCLFKIHPEEFFSQYNIHWLHLFKCKFIDCEKFSEIVKDMQVMKRFFFDHLSILQCEITILPFLTFILSHYVAVKELSLHSPFDYKFDDRQSVEMKECDAASIDNWIVPLQNNTMLLHSLEYLNLTFDKLHKLTEVFKTMNDMKNLKAFRLTINRSLTMDEVNALAHTFDNGLKRLQTLRLEFLPSYICRYFVQSISNLCSLKSLELSNEYFTSDTICHLIDLFKNLSLEESKIFFQDIFVNEKLLDAIKQSNSLIKIEFIVENNSETNFRSFVEHLSTKFGFDSYHCGVRV